MALDHDHFSKVLAYKALTDSVYLSAIADYVKPSFFDNQNIAKIFEIICDFYDKRSKLPTITEVKSYLTTDPLKNNFKKLVESFKDIDKNLDENELYENTETFLREASVYITTQELIEELSEGKIEPSEILEKFEKCCTINLTTDKGFEIYSGINRLVDDILSVESSISTGWDWLDDAIGGGWQEDGKALYLFAGKVNIGKSIFLGNVAANIAAQNKTVLIVTLEMSEMLYAKRICSNITKIPMKDFRNSTGMLRDSLLDEKKKLPKSKIFIKEFPPSTITPKQLTGFIKKLEQSGEKLDAIVIDYVNLLHSPQGNNSYEKVKYVAEQIRAMSYIFKCPVISATQLSRSFFNIENPGMEGVSESIGLVATADVMISIFQNEEDQELGIIRLGMMKNRFGMRGTTQTMKIDYNTLSISQTEEDSEVMEDDELSFLDKLATVTS